ASCCGGGASVNDVLESVALVEAALSHILNAEGEKLQKIIAVSEDPSELIAVNSSVESMVQSVTTLEEVLVRKLEALGRLDH
ncbi:MAG: hypothetical protein R3Y07_07740, partial [Eubacteriales bacterium]